MINFSIQEDRNVAFHLVLAGGTRREREQAAETLVMAMNDPALWHFLREMRRGIGDDVTFPHSADYLLALMARLGDFSRMALDEQGEERVVTTGLFKLAHTAVNWLWHMQELKDGRKEEE